MIIFLIFVFISTPIFSQPIPRPICLPMAEFLSRYMNPPMQWYLLSTFDINMTVNSGPNPWKIGIKFTSQPDENIAWYAQTWSIPSMSYTYDMQTYFKSMGDIFRISPNNEDLCMLAHGNLSSYAVPNFYYFILGYTQRQQALLFTNQDPNRPHLSLFIVPAFISFIKTQAYLALDSNVGVFTYL